MVEYWLAERLKTDELRLHLWANRTDGPGSKGTDHLIPMFHDEGACFAPASAGRVQAELV